MVAGNDDDGKIGQGLFYPGEELVILGLRFDGRIGLIENVACHQQSVSLALNQGVEQPVEKDLMLGVAVMAFQGLSQMPVGSVDEFHG